MTRNSDTLSTKSAPWKVTYQGGFWDSHGRAGKEIPLNVPFRWGEERWIVPAAYVCAEGLVLDLCMEVEPEAVRRFMEKWGPERQFTRAEEREINREHPLHTGFFPHVTLNGKVLPSDHGCGVSWIPPACLPMDREDRGEAEAVVTHYGLDPAKVWSIRRWTYHWATKNKPRAIRSLRLTMERGDTELPCTPFVSPAAGESVTIVHPLTGEAHTLTVREYRRETLEPFPFDDPGVEYPKELTAMIYTLDFPAERFSLMDCADGDTPRRKADGFPVSGSGPTGFFYIIDPGSEQLRAACSSLHFEPLSEPVTWEPVFREKLMEDVEVKLI